MKKTKIVCTMGPTTDGKDIIRNLILEGMDAARLNFSHGSYEEHQIWIDIIKEARQELGTSTAILMDTKGPGIRTGKFKEGTVKLVEGESFLLCCAEDILGDETKCSVSYKELYAKVQTGDRILINNGIVSVRVVSVEDKNIITAVENSGCISDDAGINIPGVNLELPLLTDKDKSDLLYAIKNNVDIVAASFIRDESDVAKIRGFLNKNGGAHIQLFSKIESKAGVENIDDIIEVSDGIMVARGDLGAEIPEEDVPEIQKMIIKKCNKTGTTVITATQMLDSMIRNPRPTRAEASDIANAIFDGSDSILLGRETADGRYPVESVKTMVKIAERTEECINYRKRFEKKRKTYVKTVANAISIAACKTSIDLGARAVITATQSGYTARQISKYRPKADIIACTPYEETARALALVFGVQPLIIQQVSDTDELIQKSSEAALNMGIVEKGDQVVFVAGLPINDIGSTNMLKVHTIGDKTV